MEEKKSPLKNVLDDLKTDYLKSLPAKIDKLKQLSSSKNWSELSEEYHKLKGTGKTYGFPEITLICEHMEKLIIKKDNALNNSLNDNPFTLAPKILERLLRAYERQEKYDLLNDRAVKKLFGTESF